MVQGGLVTSLLQVGVERTQPFDGFGFRVHLGEDSRDECLGCLNVEPVQFIEKLTRVAAEVLCRREGVPHASDEIMHINEGARLLLQPVVRCEQDLLDGDIACLRKLGKLLQKVLLGRP